MTLARIDWIIVAVYFALSLGVGLMFTKRASRSTDDYFLAGRTVPWWLAGISIVATTFASDTPLLVAGITARGGIAGNWIWWAFVLSGMLTVFFFAKLWRRSGVMTDVEFVAIRYSGRPAHFLSSAFAGAGLISRDHYSTFVLPYERQVIDGIHAECDVPIYTHT